MNGDELLKAFLEYVEKEKPERFYGYDFEKAWNQKIKVPDLKWSVKVAKEPCYGAYDAVLFRYREGLVYEIIPVEVKGDTDVLDDGRLRTQIWVHIRNFSKSMLIVDAEQAFKIKKLKLDKMLPSEIWAYNNVTFHQLTEGIFKYYNRGESDISQRAIEKAFGIHEPPILRALQKRVHKVQNILAKLIANQWRFAEEEKFTDEEAEIAKELFGCALPKKIIQKVLIENPSINT